MPFSDWLRTKRFLTDLEIEKIESSIKIRTLGRNRRVFVEYNSTKEFENEYERRAIRVLDESLNEIRATLPPMSKYL